MLVLGGLDLALLAAGPSFPWGLRIAILALLGFAMLVASRAIPEPERWGWLAELALFAWFTVWPPERMVPGRIVLGALLLAGLLGLLVWHARRKRKALWSGN
jgi:hypothetical protein